MLTVLFANWSRLNSMGDGVIALSVALFLYCKDVYPSLDIVAHVFVTGV